MNTIEKTSEEQQTIELSPRKDNTLHVPRNTRGNFEILCEEIDEINSVEMKPLKRIPCNAISSTKHSVKLKVRTEKSAMVLALIVILFLITHSYRMALKLYEVALPKINTMERFKICFTLKR